MLTGKFSIYVLFLLLILAGSVVGEELEFDIFAHNDSITVAIDLGPILTTRRIDDLTDGIRYATWLKVELLRPRRIWGAQTIQTSEEIIQIRYRRLTTDYAISIIDPDSRRDTTLASLAKLHQWLSQSIITEICHLDSLDHERGYEIRFHIDVLSGALNRLPDFNQGDKTSESPVKFLFDTFLELTGYGKEEYSGRSRQFMLDELDTR